MSLPKKVKSEKRVTYFESESTTYFELAEPRVTNNEARVHQSRLACKSYAFLLLMCKQQGEEEKSIKKRRWTYLRAIKEKH